MKVRNGNVSIPLETEEIRIPCQLRYKVDYYKNLQLADGSETESFRSWTVFDNEDTAYRISQEFCDDQLKLSVAQWNPHSRQGRCFPTFSFSFGPCQDIFWSRSRAMDPEDSWKSWDEPTMLLAVSKEQSLSDAFDTILQTNLKRVEISKMKDEMAYDGLYEKLLHHPTILRLTFRVHSTVKELL